MITVEIDEIAKQMAEHDNNEEVQHFIDDDDFGRHMGIGGVD